MIVSDIRPSEDRLAIPGPMTIMKRNRFMITVPVLAGVALGAAGYANAPAVYISEAVLVLDARRIQALPTEAVVSPLPQESPVLRSEIDVIGSTMMAEKVASLLRDRGDMVSAGERSDAALGAPMNEDGAVADAKRLLKGLSVTNDGHSYTIYIAFRDRDPAFAAHAADAFAQTYVDYQAQVQQQETLRVAGWLGSKLDSLRARLEASEKAAEDFRQSAGLVQVDGMSLPTQRVVTLNAELAQSGGVLAGAQARLEIAHRLLANSPVPALGEFLQSATISALRAQQDEAERKLAALEASGASKNDQIPILNSEIAAYQAQMAREVKNILESLENEVSIARQKQERVSAELSDAQARLADANRSKVRLGQLEREVEANRNIYESYLGRYKQAIEQQGVVTPEARLISSASADTRRDSPRLSNWLMLGLALGAAIGMAGALWNELVGRPVRSPRRLESLTGLRIIGHVPLLSRHERRNRHAGAQDGRTPFGRSLGRLWNALRSMLGEDKPAVLAMVSAGAGEGKTSLVVGLARHLAASGRKVVMVDADLRSPSLVAETGVAAGKFIDEMITAGCRAENLLIRDSCSNARLIAARAGEIAPEYLLSSSQFQTLLDDLKKWFDVILIDTPDLEQSPDALQVAWAADATLLVASATTIKAEPLAAAVESLAACHRLPLGIVLNRFRPRDADIPGEHVRTAGSRIPRTQRSRIFGVRHPDEPVEA